MIKIFTSQNISKKNYSAFKQHYSEIERIDKRLKLQNRNHELRSFCFVVIEYPHSTQLKPFELMYIKGSLKLLHLRQVIAKRLEDKVKGNSSFFIECNGRILEWNTSISAMSAKMADRDGFLYLFVGRQDVF